MKKAAMMESERIIIQVEQAPSCRVDQYVAQETGLSRSLVQDLIGKGNILINGEAVQKSRKLAVGDTLSVLIPPPEDTIPQPVDLPLVVVYEDAHLLVVDKPKGLVVHPAPGHAQDTLVNALLFHCDGQLSSIGEEYRPGIVHRIDKDTSGLLVVAKDNKAHEGLREQFSRHSITREYQAVVYGGMKEMNGIIDRPIGRSRADRKKMAVVETGGKQAITYYSVVQNYLDFAHLRLELKTGRTHQIRVHMASIGHPVAGDPVYGPKKVISSLKGQCLHAGTLGFIHPVTGKELLFHSDLPDYFVGFLGKLR